ncbi:tyrosine-type recombinase/integrase [Isoptericola sp. NPDC019482]|uniref:tyrosine-type recombinase/integrase n=1 Tax=Isoptericola sp. NPDC019482 TaxID=3154688 RepID=UPI00346AD0E1
MQLGTHGAITVTAEATIDGVWCTLDKHRDGTWWTLGEPDKRVQVDGPERWRARTVVRDLDGKNRQVRRYAPTKAKAVTALTVALRDREAPSATTIGYRPTTTVTDAAALWLGSSAYADLAERSRDQYAATVRNHVTGSQIAALTLREVNVVSVVESWLQAVAKTAGAGAAKTARSVLSNIMGAALRDRAVQYNAVRSTRVPKADKGSTSKTRTIGRGKSATVVKVEGRDTARAFTKAERDAIVAAADGYAGAKRNDVADVIAFMAGTGTRIREALAVRWEDFDADAGTVFVDGTKSANGARPVHLPPWLRDRLVQRAKVKGMTGVIFASPGNPRRPDLVIDKERPRDARNVTRIVREVLDLAGFTWATSHSFRRSAATIADGAGVSLNEIARSLGQDPATTARFYLARNVDTSAMAGAL